jgi:hypothetical protein
MTLTVQVPDDLAQQCHLDAAAGSRQLLEAFVLQRFAEGELTDGQVGEALGLSFHETAQFLHAHQAPPQVTAAEQRADLANLERILGR